MEMVVIYRGDMHEAFVSDEGVYIPDLHAVVPYTAVVVLSEAA